MSLAPAPMPAGARFLRDTTTARRHGAASPTAVKTAAATSPEKTPKGTSKGTPQGKPKAGIPKGTPKGAKPKATKTQGNQGDNIGSLPPKTDDDDKSDDGNGDEQQESGGNGAEAEVEVSLEERMKRVEEETKLMSGEIQMLRDRLEEVEWAKKALEDKVETVKVENSALKEMIEREKEARKRECDKIRELKRKEGNGGGGGCEEELREKITEVGERPERRLEEVVNGGGEKQQESRKRQRCVIITDSNGRGATENSIKNHIPRGERDNYDIAVRVSYTTEDATRCVDRGDILVRGATVVLDNLTNDIRDNGTRKAASPQELLRRVDRLRKGLYAAGATAVVTCQIKPMQTTDVTPYNAMLSDYIWTQGMSGYGCRTQIRLSHLKNDGYHVLPQYDSTIDKTYACALIGISVPCPTPMDEFTPNHLRRRWAMDWPRVGRGQQMNHGW